MKTYVCYYNCPHCKHPFCGCDPMMPNANEMVHAETKEEAKRLFNELKPCRNIKLLKVEEYCDKLTVTNITVTSKRWKKEVVCKSLDEAIMLLVRGV